jgi:hypothetical protein
MSPRLQSTRKLCTTEHTRLCCQVTDFLEQKELDSAKASRALASITAEETVDREAERERERELAAVAIDQVWALPAPRCNSHLHSATAPLAHPHPSFGLLAVLGAGGG